MTTIGLKAGLEGVVAAETRLSSVDGLAGELIIAGFPLEELAGKATFEETIYLLWHDALPTPEALSAFRAELAAHRAVPAPQRSGSCRDRTGARVAEARKPWTGRRPASQGTRLVAPGATGTPRPRAEAPAAASIPRPSRRTTAGLRESRRCAGWREASDHRCRSGWPDRHIRRGPGLGWPQQPRDRAEPQADRPELWLRQFQYECRRIGRRAWRLHHAGGRAGILCEGHYARVVQQSAFRFGHSQCASGWRSYAHWFL